MNRYTSKYENGESARRASSQSSARLTDRFIYIFNKYWSNMNIDTSWINMFDYLWTDVSWSQTKQWACMDDEHLEDLILDDGEYIINRLGKTARWEPMPYLD